MKLNTDILNRQFLLELKQWFYDHIQPKEKLKIYYGISI